MKFCNLKILFCSLFCILLFCSYNVLGAEVDIYVPNLETMSDDVSTWTFYNSVNGSYAVNNTSSYTVSNIGGRIEQAYLTWFKELAESGWVSTALPKFDVEYNYHKLSDDKKSVSKANGKDSFNLIDGLDSGSLKDAFGKVGCHDGGSSGGNFNIDGAEIVITMTLGNDTFKIHTQSSKYYFKGSDGTYSSKEKTASQETAGKNVSRSNENAKKIIAYFQESAMRGIAAGSVEFGYNIGIPYSAVQRPISDLMELKGNGYEFKSVSSIAYTFGYFYNPILGNMYLNKETYLPSTTRADEVSEETGKEVTKEDLWLEEIKKKKSSIFKSGSIVIPKEFVSFVNNLSDENVNEKGYKLTDVKIEHGATKYNMSNAGEPKNVLSYNIPMAVPYIFGIVKEQGKLVTSNLRLIEGFVYCLYNDCIYKDDTMERVASMEFEVGVPRENVYLYYQTLQGENTDPDAEPNYYKTGIGLIGVFDECVVDFTAKVGPKATEKAQLEGGIDPSDPDSIVLEGTKENYLKHTYLTGRKIGFDNGYSDAIDIRERNMNLLYVKGESGKDPYLPLNIMFPTDIEFTEASIFLDVLYAPIASEYKDLTDNLKQILDYEKGTEFFDVLWDPEVHGEVPSTIRAVKLYIDFGKIVNQDKVKEEVDDEGNVVVKELGEASKYAFYCVRNNAYLYDEDLIAWLETDMAKSLTYVNADTLLDKILGNFTGNLTKIRYGDWKAMQQIREDIQNDKDAWLIRLLNVVSIVFGTVLIIFAILFVLAYWFDIFNTFTELSVLQFVSFGNLYPVADKITESYLMNRHGSNIKFVDFKGVLIISGIMMAMGILFLNTFTLISFIVSVYNYIMFLFGGL